MTAAFLRGGVGDRNGVAAAMMAKVGYDAPRDIFDGEPGFFHSRLGVPDPDTEFLRGLGEEYGVMGLIFKRHNAVGSYPTSWACGLEKIKLGNLLRYCDGWIG